MLSAYDLFLWEMGHIREVQCALKASYLIETDKYWFTTLNPGLQQLK